MKRIAAVTVCGLVLAGCGPAGSRPASADYYPLGVGSTWRYHVYYIDSTGHEQAGTARQGNEVRVAGSARLANGEDAAMVVTRMDQPYVIYETTYARNTGGFVVSCLKLDSKLRDTVLVLPPAAGKTWHRLVGGKPKASDVFAAQETVRVAAGTYLAWRADETIEGSELRNHTWYAPGVGMVKVVLDMTAGSKLVVELVSASIK